MPTSDSGYLAVSPVCEGPSALEKSLRGLISLLGYERSHGG